MAVKRSEFDKVRLDRAAAWVIDNDFLHYDLTNKTQRRELMRIYGQKIKSRRNKFYWKHVVEAMMILKLVDAKLGVK